MSSPAPAKPSKVRQACDVCHKRKIRCDGCRPCHNCQSLDLSCTYLAVPKKTGPKGPRYARRPIQRPAATTFQRPTSPGKDSPGIASNTTASPQCPKEFVESPQMTDTVIQWCLDAYFKHKYPLTPILHRPQLEQMPRSTEQYGLITACCAVIALSPEILPPCPVEDNFTIPSADFLITETLRAREFCNLIEHPSMMHIQTSFFLHAASFSMDKDNSAWYYLQEAITMLQTLRLHEETTYQDTTDTVFATYAQRMFWVLFITERAYALQRNRPIRLQDTLKLPAVDPTSSDAEILRGFLDLISLFRPFGQDFISQWNCPTSSTSTDFENLSRLQCLLKYALPDLSNHSPVQQADLLISRHWLKVVVWKLCASKRVLSTANSEDVMSLHYPASIARDIVLVSQLIPTQAFEANGIGIVEKVFDVGCSLADLLSLVPLEYRASTMDIGVIDTLMETVRIVGTRFGGSYRHLDILVDKASGCLMMNVDRSLPPPDQDDPDTF
ncbi:sucrose utilization SUC1 [Fusarium beomiforme]|uniref:Sucrose utilization SUC1 n=1 Tax=Fusarium beomiforme TaxID=44412 RepID=A0A9P5ART6_9HYPO|nr:sucrose utilization SUC1 [Fusarium beomiforme]